MTQRREYIVQDKMGLHARSISLIARLALPYKETKISISCQEKTVSATHLTAMMALQVMQGDLIVLTVEGEDEKEIADKILKFLITEKL